MQNKHQSTGISEMVNNKWPVCTKIMDLEFFFSNLESLYDETRFSMFHFSPGLKTVFTLMNFQTRVLIAQ